MSDAAKLPAGTQVELSQLEHRLESLVHQANNGGGDYSAFLREAERVIEEARENDKQTLRDQIDVLRQRWFPVPQVDQADTHS